MDVSELEQAKYVRLTTYRRDGRAVTCPVWLARTGDTFAFTTDGDSGKVKRLRNDARVEVSVSDVRGRVAMGARTYVGTARVLTGADIAPVERAIRRKYGIVGQAIVLGGALKAKVLRRAPSHAAVELRINATR